MPAELWLQLGRPFPCLLACIAHFAWPRRCGGAGSGVVPRLQLPYLPGLPSCPGADALSRYIDWRDRSTCILFGDGCGAVVLSAKEDGSCGLLGLDMHSGGRHAVAEVPI